MVNVIKSVSDIGCDLHSREPIRENRKVGVFWISEAICKVRAVNVLVYEVDVIAGHRCSEELDQANEMTLAYQQQLLLELRRLDRPSEPTLDNEDVFAAYRAPPSGGRRGGREPFGKEVVGGFTDLGELVDVRIFR